MSQNPPRENGDGERPIEVEDPDDYNLSRRYQQIHRARDHVKEVRAEAGTMASRGEMSLERYREELAQAVADFAMELEWLIRKDDEDESITESDIWDSVEIEAPLHPNGKIEGIGGFVDRYGVIEVEEEIENESGLPGEQRRETHESMAAPSVETTMRIYRQCNRFMNDIGLDVKFDQGLPRDSLP